MNNKNPLALRILAWCVGGYLFLMFLLLHALMLVAGIEESKAPRGTDWIFILVFLLLLERVFHALRIRLRGLRKAGQIFRTFLGVSAFLGLTGPLSMVLAFLRVGLREPVPGMGGFIYYFFAFWGVVGGLVCFFARYLFEKPPARGPTPNAFPLRLRGGNRLDPDTKTSPRLKGAMKKTIPLLLPCSSRFKPPRRSFLLRSCPRAAGCFRGIT